MEEPKGLPRCLVPMRLRTLVMPLLDSGKPLVLTSRYSLSLCRSHLRNAEEEIERLRVENCSLTKENRDLRSVDHQQSIQALQEEIVQLKEDLLYYTNIHVYGIKNDAAATHQYFFILYASMER